MEKILTISIAAYNVEKYINQAINSLLDKQILDYLEILIIDDGGTDKTLKIANEYAKKYPNSIFPIHKENGGYGSTINMAVKIASGKYFKQLDGDDWFNIHNLTEFINILKSVDADCVLSQVTSFYEKNSQTIDTLGISLPDGSYKTEDLNRENFYLSMHEVTFKTAILKKINLNLTEHCFYTDLEYVNYTVPYLNTFYIWNKPIYIYRIGREGQSISVEGVRKHYKEHELIFWHLADIYEILNKKNMCAHKNIVLSRLINETESHFKYLCFLPFSKKSFLETLDFYNNLKSNHIDILNITCKRKKWVKIYTFSGCLLYPIIRFVFFLHFKLN